MTTRVHDILLAHGVRAAAEPGYTPGSRTGVIAALKRIGFQRQRQSSVFSVNGSFEDRVSVSMFSSAVAVNALDKDVIRYTLPLQPQELQHVLEAAVKLSRTLPGIVDDANAKVAAEAERVFAVIRDVKPTTPHLSLQYDDGFTLAPA